MSSPLDDIRSALKMLQAMPITRYVCTESIPATSTDPDSLGEMLMVKHKEGNITRVYFHPDNYPQIYHAVMKKELEMSSQDPGNIVLMPAWNRTPEADKIQAAFWLYIDGKKGN